MKSINEEIARRCSVKKVFLEISQNSQENTCSRVSFLIKFKARIRQKLWSSIVQYDHLDAELVKFILEKRKRNLHMRKSIIKKKVMPVFPELYLDANVQSMLQLDI